MDDLVEDAVVGICECWAWEDVGGVAALREQVIQQVQQAKTLNGVDLQSLADEMSKEVAGGEGWTIADARLLKDVFNQYDVVFKVEV